MKHTNATIIKRAIIAGLCLVAVCGSLSHADDGKTLIVYYSLTGNTKAGCEALQGQLQADMLPIRDLTDRTGKFGFFRSAFGSLLGFHTKIEPEQPDLSAYANLVIGSPIWTGKLSIPIRTFIDKNRFEGKKVVLYTTTNALEQQKYKDKSSNLVTQQGGDVRGYFQVQAADEVDGEKVPRPKERIVQDTLKLVPDIRRALSLK